VEENLEVALEKELVVEVVLVAMAVLEEELVVEVVLEEE
jgi:hypothetical protein